MATMPDELGFDERPKSVVPIKKAQPTALVSASMQREVAEVQAAMMIARMNPRDEMEARDRILTACTNPKLAEVAVYCYSRGGTDISGPSIRLAEAMAQEWGNIEFGIRELEQRDGESTVESYCWDIQKNVRQKKTFQVPHIRYSRNKGNTVLTDPRDIYELVANSGARRLRACILGIVPGDVVDAAVKQCETTLSVKAQVTPERIKSLLEKFEKHGVTKEQIEKRIQRHMDAMTPAQMVQLGKIYVSLEEGMSSAKDWFQGEKVGPEKGTVDLSSIKPSATENKGHGNEGLDAAKKSKPAAKPVKSNSAPQENQNYGVGDDGDPGPLFDREPGSEG